MGPGMIAFFKHMKAKMMREGVDEAVFESMFSGIKGVVLLDTLAMLRNAMESLKS